MNDNELAECLKNWIKTVNPNEKNFWCRNPVASIIKQWLIRSERWKNKPNGQAKKGYKAMKYAIAKKNGYEGPPIEE